MKRYALKEYLAFLEAYFFLHLTKFVILVIPFRKIAAQLGKLHHETERVELDRELWIDVEVAIIRASRFCLHKSKCYDQALTGKIMLLKKGIPSTLYFGLKKETKELKAHAWVRAGNRVVTGRKGMELFTAIAWYGDNW